MIGGKLGHEDVIEHADPGIRLEPGKDGVSLTLVASLPVQCRHIRGFEDCRRDGPRYSRCHALDAITDRYGERTAHVLAMQLEYPVRRGPMTGSNRESPFPPKK